MTFLLLWSLRASVVALLGLGLSLVLRRRSAATRSLVLRITLAVMALVPLASFVAPRIEVPVAPPALAPREAPSAVGQTFVTPVRITEGWSVRQTDPQDVGTVGFVRQTPYTSAWTPAISPLTALWTLGTGILILRWLVGFGRLKHLARRLEAVPVERGNALLRHEAFGGRRVTIRYASVSVPMTYGRTILMPHQAATWPEARVRAALLHEAAHVRRRDWAWQTLSGLFCAVHWMNPLAWMVAKALRAHAEAAADDEAIRDMRPSDYAQALLDVAAQARRAGPALAMARRGGVAHRIRAVLSRRERRGPSRRTVAIALGLSTLAGLGIAGTTLRQARKKEPTQANPPRGAYPLRTGGSLRLTALYEGRRAWRPTGERLPERLEKDSFRPSPGRRGVTFEFERVESGQPNGPGILTRDFLHQTGTPTLLVDTPDEIQMVAPFPRNVSSSTGDAGSRIGPDGRTISHPTFSRELDPNMTTTEVVVRLSSGPATPSDEPVRVLQTERRAQANWTSGRWHPGVSVRAFVPKALRGETVLLRAFDAQGLMIEGSSPVAPFPDGTVSVTYDVANPSEIARFQWAHRRPEFVRIGHVALRPADTPRQRLPESGPDRVGESS